MYVVTDCKVHVANMGPIWGRQDPCGPHVGSINFVIWVFLNEFNHFNVNFSPNRNPQMKLRSYLRWKLALLFRSPINVDNFWRLLVKAHFVLETNKKKSGIKWHLTATWFQWTHNRRRIHHPQNVLGHFLQGELRDKHQIRNGVSRPPNSVSCWNFAWVYITKYFQG